MDTNTTVLTGNVRIVQGSLVVKAARADITQDKGEVSRALLTGAPATLKQTMTGGGELNASASTIDYKLAEESVKARELGPTQIVTNGAGLANNATGTVAVNCPAGTQMVSGGGTTTLGGNDLVLVLRSFPSTNGWVVTYRNISTVAVTITAVATCLSA